jgi:hypothetical protein
MPRTGRRRSLSAVTAALALLAAPAAAQAATYTVKSGDGPCGGADLACGGLTEAAAAAASGDVFNIAQGIYGSAEFAVGGVTLTGSPAFTVNGTITFSSNAGGVSKLQKAAINQNVGAGYGVVVSGSAGLEISDSVILSNNGDGVRIHEGTTNKIVRTVVGTGGLETAAVRVLSADNSPNTKKLVMESTLVSGGLAGLSVNTGEGNGLLTEAGDVEVVLRHVTSAGSTHGLILDASKANRLIGGPFGDIVASVTDSIIQNGTLKMNYPGILTGLVITAPPNTVTDSYTRTLQAPFDPNTVFVDAAKRNFRLKAGSVAINAGGFTAGESTTDIDGQDRSAAPTDLGADEYVAPPPAAPLPPPPGATNDGTPPAVVITKPTQNQKIRLTTKTTRTRTVTRNGKRVRVKTTTTKRNRISFAGTAADPSGVRGVVFTLQKLSSSTGSGATAPTAPTAKCRFFNATKGLVLKTCSKPILVLAKFAAGKWTYNVRSTIKLSSGTYRLITAGADNSGAFGNSAPAKDAVHRFVLLK